MTEYLEQPQPQETQNPHIVDLVIEDMKARNELGIKRYGTALQAFNGRDALQDAYEEQLDQIVYTKQWMIEKHEIRNNLEKLLNDIHSLSFTEKYYISNQLKQILSKLG